MADYKMLHLRAHKQYVEVKCQQELPLFQLKLFREIHTV